jgi:replicative DNA helicase
MRVSKLVEGWVMRGLGSEEIQVEAAKARKELGLSARLSSSDGKEEFEKRLFAAIDGIKFEFPVSPFLASVREKVPYYEPGDYVVVAASTGTGKTYYALNQIHYISIKGVPSCLINLENTPANMQKRMWQMHSKIRFRPDLRGTDEQIRHYLKAWEEVKAMPFRSYNPGPTLPAIVSAIRQDWNERRIQLAVVDYAQLINIPGYRGNRNYELGEISATFRALALELQIPVIVLAQMKQEVAKTSDKRGGLYDIKDCANFAQDATIVQCLYRPEMFDISTRELANGSIEPYPEKYADVFMAKGRESGVALSEARFDPVLGFFDAPQATQFPATAHYSFNVPRADFDKEDVPF